jgi:uncharacterized RDD family membrane protein YckC
MRCPKCQYIAFDSGERCRNCGYEFSFAPNADPFDLPIQTGDEPEGPLSVPDTVPPRPITQSFDLPLFNDRGGAPDDRPLVSVPAVPRQPLSVRKPAPVAPRPSRRDATEEPRLDLALPDVDPDADDEVEDDDETFGDPVEETRWARPAFQRVADADTQTASAGARLLAAVIDLVLLLGIDLAVLHFTLKILRLEYADVLAVPAAPFISFLLILNGSYVTGFTAAGGQSIGKMAAGIKVVPSDPHAWTDRVPFGQAVLRAVSYLVSALPAGLGFVPALFGTDKRALHDRLAHTRVVKV